MHVSADSCISLLCRQLASLLVLFKPPVGTFAYGRARVFEEGTSSLQFPKAFFCFKQSAKIRQEWSTAARDRVQER